MTARPRVLLLTPDYPPARGGIQNLLHGIVRHATRVQFRVVTLGAGTDGAECAPTRRIAPRGSRGQAVAMLNLVAATETRRWQPDVVLSGHIVLSPAARMLDRPWVQYIYAKEVAHRQRLGSFALRHASASIVLGRHGRMLALRAGAVPERVHEIPPGIDIPPAPSTRAGARAPGIVNVARLEDRYKGFEVLVRALPLVRARVPAAQLTFVGSGPLRPSLERLARANGCEGAVRWAGTVDDVERDRLLASARVFAMPSRVSASSGGEGFGIVYLEAGGHGTPVVAGNVGGALDAVVDGRTGLLVRPDDHIEVAEAISRLLLDDALATSLGRGGRAWAEGFAWPLVVPRIEQVLLDVAAAARP